MRPFSGEETEFIDRWSKNMRANLLAHGLESSDSVENQIKDHIAIAYKKGRNAGYKIATEDTITELRTALSKIEGRNETS